MDSDGYKFSEEEIRKTVEGMDFGKLGGIIPAVTVDENGRVLMLAFMNKEALVKTLQTGSMHYWSRSRQKLWMKGEESGHRQYVLGAYVDCDSDSILFKVHQVGPACHTGNSTCFNNVVREYILMPEVIEELESVIKDRMRKPQEGSHTSEVIERGMKEAAKKVGEEAFEVSVAALSEDKERTVSEAADLLYHLMILLQLEGADMKEVFMELAKRRRQTEHRSLKGQGCLSISQLADKNTAKIYIQFDDRNHIMPQERQAKQFCHKCGSEVPKGSVYCSMCGEKYHKDA